MDLPNISIIICTLNRKKSLKNCLNYLLKIDYPKNKHEIIVIDGGSTDGTDNLVQTHFPDIKFIIDKRKGVSYARNTGARYAQGDYVVYTDDDCIVECNWLYNLLSGFSSSKIGAVGGPVRFLNPDIIPEKIVVKAAFGLYDKGDKTQNVNELITANIAVRSDIFQEIKFDTKLGRRGKKLYDLEDIDFCRTILDHGFQLVYNPNAVVYHDIDINKINVKYILSRAIRGGISLYFMKKKWIKLKRKLLYSILRSMMGYLMLFFKKRTMENLYLLISSITTFFTMILMSLKR